MAGIKPLKWVNDTAKSPFGDYEVYWEGDYGWLCMVDGYDDTWVKYPDMEWGYDTKEGAIAECERDYLSRMAPYIVPEPTPGRRDMDSAPKDGTIVILTHKYWRTVGIAQYRYPEGWCHYADGTKVDHQECITSWMPLPPAPGEETAPVTVREGVTLGAEHDEALDWVTSNCTEIRRDNGDMDYSLGQMIRAFEAGRNTTSVHDAAKVLWGHFTGEDIETDFKPAWEEWRKVTWDKDGSIYEAMASFLHTLASKVQTHENR